MEGAPTPELRRQATRLLEKLAVLSGQRLQLLRAVEALEYMNTPEARRVLQATSEGEPEARLTREAKAALERLSKRQ